MTVHIYLLICVSVLGTVLALDCDRFIRNQILEFTPINLVGEVLEVENAETCQMECNRVEECKFFTWAHFSSLGSICYLFRERGQGSPCEGECTESLSGPRSPEYPAVCCSQFSRNFVCQDRPDNTVERIENVPGLLECQSFCQDEFTYIDCNYFLYNTVFHTCILLSDCKDEVYLPSGVSGPKYPSIDKCEEFRPETTTTSTIGTTHVPTTSYLGQTTVLLLAGEGGQADSYPCNLDTNAMELPANVKSVNGAGAAVLEGQIYFCGGTLNNYDSEECLGFLDGGWKAVPSLQSPRSFFTLDVVGYNLYAVGGRAGLQFLKSIEMFDGERWTTLATELPTPRYLHCTVPISDHEFVVIGGVNVKTITSIDKYDIQKNVWTHLADLEQPREGHACVWYNSLIIISGGYVDGREVKSVVSFDPARLEFNALPSLRLGRAYHTIEVVDGEMVVFGGAGEFASVSAEVLEEMSWSLIQLRGKHVYHSSVVYPCSQTE